jgi:hypothetical protein
MGSFEIGDYDKMVKPPSWDQIANDLIKPPRFMDEVNEAMVRTEKAAIAEFQEKYPNKPFTTFWRQKDGYTMVFTVQEVPTI